MSDVHHFLCRFKQLDETSIKLLAANWQKKKNLSAKEMLVDFDQRDTNLYFVVKGCVRLFVVNQKDEAVTIGFGYENTIITSFQSFVEEKPSALAIEAVLPAELMYITKTSLMELIAAHHDIAKWYQTIIEQTLSGHIQRQIELLTLRPRGRYDAFVKRSGHLVNTLPLKLIASYLMMTPETLSRIRANNS
jgi:CRP-like cAMP-binding protein